MEKTQKREARQTAPEPRLNEDRFPNRLKPKCGSGTGSEPGFGAGSNRTMARSVGLQISLRLPHSNGSVRRISPVAIDIFESLCVVNIAPNKRREHLSGGDCQEEEYEI